MAEALKLDLKEAIVGDCMGYPAVYFELQTQSARAYFEFMRKSLNKVVIFRVDGREILRAVAGTYFLKSYAIFPAWDTNEAIALAERLNSGSSDFEIKTEA